MNYEASKYHILIMLGQLLWWHKRVNKIRDCVYYFLPSALNLTIYVPGTLLLSMRLGACVVSLT